MQAKQVVAALQRIASKAAGPRRSRHLERVQDFGNLELLMLRLPELVGSPLSINAVREDLQLTHKTVASWLQILERLYAIYRLSPFGAPRIHAVKKEQKHYHWDWSVVQEPSLRFENLVAGHLLKWTHHQHAKGRDVELRYFRDTDRREVDFVIVEGRAPQVMVECKWTDTEVDRSLRYLKARFPKSQYRRSRSTPPVYDYFRTGAELLTCNFAMTAFSADGLSCLYHRLGPRDAPF